jgi:hypothetical protein
MKINPKQTKSESINFPENEDKIEGKLKSKTEPVTSLPAIQIVEESDKLDASPKANTNESKIVESEPSEHIRETATHTVEPLLVKEDIKVQKDDLVKEKSSELAIPAHNKNNSYKSRILLLRQYTNSIMTEIQIINSRPEESYKLSLIGDECNYIANLLKKIMPYITLGMFC